MREETVVFESYDLSSDGVVRPSALLRRLQEIAGRDLDSYGISYADLRNKNMAFVVSKIALVFERPLTEETPYVIRTAAQAAHGATFPRSFVIEDDKGVVARANSLWALLDFEKRSLLRASALGDDLPDFPDLSGGLVCERLGRVKDAEPDFFDERRVYASLLDRNCHLNNCNYADLATDLLPDDAGEVREIHITFQKEARLHDVLSLQAYVQDGGFLVCGSFRDHDHNCFLASIKTF
ncbi:MAG: hypothetical protein IJC26_05625 [Clostridia bacterium]|nr:hypothetical protein [Clostridia bacterium]